MLENTSNMNDGRVKHQAGAMDLFIKHLRVDDFARHSAGLSVLPTLTDTWPHRPVKTGNIKYRILTGTY